MAPHPHILGVILAGGESRRMGGGDKGLTKLRGEPMLAHVIAHFRPQLKHLILNANGDATRFEHFGIEVVPDADGGGKGPLAGLLAAIRWARSHRPHVTTVASVSTDAPFLPDNLVDTLQNRASGGAAVAQYLDQVHWAIGLWPLSMQDAAAAALARDQLSLRDFANASGAIRVAFPSLRIGNLEVDPFFNANTPDDLKFAEALLAAQKHEAQ